jgi:hypothetical protein
MCEYNRMYVRRALSFRAELRLLLLMVVVLTCPFLLPALHDFGAHLQQTVLCLALREASNGLSGAINVELGESSCLLDAVALDYKCAGLG